MKKYFYILILAAMFPFSSFSAGGTFEKESERVDKVINDYYLKVAKLSAGLRYCDKISDAKIVDDIALKQSSDLAATAPATDAQAKESLVDYIILQYRGFIKGYGTAFEEVDQARQKQNIQSKIINCDAVQNEYSNFVSATSKRTSKK